MVESTLPAPYVYTDLNEAPESLRRLDGGRLSVAQVNEIVADAYRTGTVDGDDEHGAFRMDLGGARARFCEAHHIDLGTGLWVDGPAPTTEELDGGRLLSTRGEEE